MGSPQTLNGFDVQSASTLWHRETSVPAISTCCQNLDNILGNGIEFGTVTELVGHPGTGKTQLCLQLCASVQIPKCLGGLEGEAVYIDTNTNFRISRFEEIALHCYLRSHDILSKEPDISIEELLSIIRNKLHYIDGFGLVKYCAVVHKLPHYISKHPNIKLIVIDSIIFPYKESIDERDRTRLLFQHIAQLQRVAVEKQIAIILTNELSTRVGLSDDQIVVAAGDSWSHRCNTRVLLSQQYGCREASIVKSNKAKQASTLFKITKEGVRDDV